MLAAVIPLSDDLQAYIREGADQGLRVLMFAYSPTVPDLQDGLGNPVLPPDLRPLGILRFGDELRPDAYQTLEGFRLAGIQVKVISGDNPATVAALAKQAGLSDDILAVSGQELAQMDEAVFTQTAEESTIFGRITPEQKAKLVESLQSRNCYVAMMGDGVNDVLSLKQANVGVAMESGSQATRGVADIVLLNDTFSALPKVFLEGQRIRNGISDITKLFMVRIFSFAITIIAVGMITLTFPFSIKASTIVTFFTVGLPPFFVTLWAKPDKPRATQGDPFLHFVLPATLTLSLASILVYLLFMADNLSPLLDWINGRVSLEELDRLITPADIALAQQVAETALITMQVFGGLLLLPFLKPPSTAWVGGEPLNGDWRYALLAGVVFLMYVAVLAIAPLRNFFEVSPLDLEHYLAIGLGAIIWALVVRFCWRRAILDRFLGITISPY